MSSKNQESAVKKIGGGARVQILTLVLVLLLMSTLNALVDFVLHPDISFFDKEHLIVGGVTGLATAIMFGALIVYLRHLNRALSKIHALEAILPICSHCKRIRKPQSDPKDARSWLPFESYITAQTTAQFSHGVCPECAGRFYPQYRGDAGQT